MPDIRPIQDQVLVRFTDIQVQTMTAGGLHIPGTAKVFKHRLLRKGAVVAVGAKVTPDRVKLGDEVLFEQQSGYEVPAWPGHPHAELELRMIREDDLLGVIE